MYIHVQSWICKLCLFVCEYFFIVGNFWNVTLLVSDPMVQRCVIIQKDEKGYGLTVSGDNPVFVQSVREGKFTY